MDSLRCLAAGMLGAIGALMAVAGMLWLAVITAGTREPFNADPAVIAMGIPDRRHAPRQPSRSETPTPAMHSAWRHH